MRTADHRTPSPLDAGPRARADLVRAHGPRVWSLCRRLSPDPEDCYQEVWEKVLGAIDRFDPEGPATLATWIATIAHRHLVDRHRRRKVRGVVVELGELVDPAPTAEGVVHLRQRADRLEVAISRLPEPHRRVVVLHHLHGLSLEDIAATEGVPVGTVKSRLHRARARLVRTLGDPP